MVGVSSLPRRDCARLHGGRILELYENEGIAYPDGSGDAFSDRVCNVIVQSKHTIGIRIVRMIRSASYYLSLMATTTKSINNGRACSLSC